MKLLVLICLPLAGCILERDIGQNSDTAETAEAFTILAEGPRYAVDVVSDDETLYWLTSGGTADRSTLHRVAKDGGPAVELARFGKIAHSLRLDEEFVYVTVFLPGAADGDGEVTRVPKGGGAVEVLGADLGSAFLSAVDDTHAYYAFLHGVDRHSIARVAKAGGVPEVLVSDIEVVTQLAVDETHLYYTQGDAGLVMRVAKDGGAPEQLASGLLGAGHLVLDDTHAYFTSCKAGNCSASTDVNSISKDLGTLAVLATLPGGYGEIAVAAGYVFLAGGFSGTVVGLPLGGGSPLTILSDRLRPMGVTSDDDAQRVFWVDFDNGDVGRIDFMEVEP